MDKQQKNRKEFVLIWKPRERELFPLFLDTNLLQKAKEEFMKKKK